MSEPESTDTRTHWLLAAWLTVFFCIYAAAKVHTWITMGTVQYFEWHWAFWVASGAWVALGAGVDWAWKTRRRRRSARGHVPAQEEGGGAGEQRVRADGRRHA